MRPASAVGVAEPAGDGRVDYDVVLLAGTPRRHTLRLAPDIVAETVIEAEGERWTVADVRATDGAPPQLICIYLV